MSRSNVVDLNEVKMTRGVLPDPDMAATPANAAAKKQRAEQPRTLTEAQVVNTAYELARQKKPEVCTSGMRRIDDATGGIIAGFTWVVGAETSWGKSSACVMMADENATRGRRVMIVSSEDDEALYGARLLCRRGRINADRYRQRCMETEEWDRAAAVANAADKARPFFLDARGRHAEWVAEHVERIVRQHEIHLVLFDYLQEFRSNHRHQDRRVEVSSVAKLLRDSTKLPGAASVIFSQITAGQGGKKYPDKYSLRESQDVANAADVVALGFTAKEPLVMEGRDPIPKDSKCLSLDKVKNGRTTTIALLWNQEYACFESDFPRTYAIGAEFDAPCQD